MSLRSSEGDHAKPCRRDSKARTNETNMRCFQRQVLDYADRDSLTTAKLASQLCRFDMLLFIIL